MHNLVTLGNAVKARRVYEAARLEHPDKKYVVLTHGETKIKADQATYQAWIGAEVGARTQLFEAGHHTVVRDVYSAQDRKELESERGE